MSLASACLFLAVPVVSQGEVWLGIDVLAADGLQELRGKRVGLITNPSGVNRHGISTIDVLLSVPEVRLVALFGPEHGIRGLAKAGDRVSGGTDEVTGLPVYSLYGNTRKPTPEMLKGLDVLVYDLQDTGVRSYTFISTMGLAMEACAEAGVAFMVLDRPNPLGGLRVEGPTVEPGFRSFVSEWNVPYAYGMTCGELARMINGERWIAKPCQLSVVPMKRWRRWMTWKDTGLKWIATSPNIPTADAALGLAALGLVGELGSGSGLTIGGRLQRPFQALSAPWLDADALSRHLSRHVKGVEFPTFSTVRDGRIVHGVELRFTDPARARLVSVNFHVMDAIRRVSGRNLVREAEEAGRDLTVLDKAAGSDRWRKELRAGRSASEIVKQWAAGEDSFARHRAAYLLYEELAGPAATPPARAVAPGKGPTASPHANGQPRVVTVQRGDTASKLARDLGTTVTAIAEANPGLDVSKLKPGAKVNVPR
jgi:uncharacterized protein YbbC (DUF1343 family)